MPVWPETRRPARRAARIEPYYFPLRHLPCFLYDTRLVFFPVKTQPGYFEHLFLVRLRVRLALVVKDACYKFMLGVAVYRGALSVPQREPLFHSGADERRQRAGFLVLVKIIEDVKRVRCEYSKRFRIKFQAYIRRILRGFRKVSHPRYLATWKRDAKLRAYRRRTEHVTHGAQLYDEYPLPALFVEFALTFHAFFLVRLARNVASKMNTVFRYSSTFHA